MTRPPSSRGPKSEPAARAVSRRYVPFLLAASVLLLIGGIRSAADPAQDRPHESPEDPPNFVFILVDDLGYMDVGANNPGTFYRTPNIDGLAAEGYRFTNGYAANPVCSPTRYSIMTGKYPTRVQATNWFSGVRSGRYAPAPLNDRMPLEETTIAEALREAGYRTAFIGKWHLGPTEEYWPEAQGFDINVGGHSYGYPPSYFAPFGNPKIIDGPDGQYLTNRLGDEALALLERFKHEPFLLFISFYSVHTPLQAPAEVVSKYARREDVDDGFGEEEQVWPTDEPRRVRLKQSHPKYAAMVELMDAQVGRVTKRLAELGLDDETYVFVMSDNGGLSTSEGHSTSNLPLRGGKGWLYEGGIRVPWIVRAPNSVSGSVVDHPVTSTDFYPTILELAGLPLRPAQHLDGISFASLLCEDSEQERPLFWHYPHYSNQGGFPGGAIREGRYKLIERYEDGRIHLYDLEADVGEQTDVAAAMPERAAAMRERLHAWYDEVNAHFLRPKGGGPQPWRPTD